MELMSRNDRLNIHKMGNNPKVFHCHLPVLWSRRQKRNPEIDVNYIKGNKKPIFPPHNTSNCVTMSHNPNLFTSQTRKLSFIAMNSREKEKETQEMAREVQLNPLEQKKITKDKSLNIIVAASCRRLRANTIKDSHRDLL